MAEYYNSNPNLKTANISIQYTEEQIQEYIKCKSDPVYFIDNYCKIITLDHGLVPFKLYECQKNKLNVIHNNRKVILLEGRQQGKTITSAAYILWYTNFNDAKTVAILANKATAAREVMARYQLMFEELPFWLKQGVVTWNKGDVQLENMSKVFTAATTGSGIRGKSCVTGDTKICIEDNDNIFYTDINTLQETNCNFIEVKKMLYTIYQTTNKVNGKIYVGFHQINEDWLLSEFNEFGSVFKDGYLGSGKLLKKAVEKYKPDSFSQKILGIYDNKEDAEKLEASIVDKDFTLRKDTYNMAIGGNVRIMYGANNGFFGKSHTEENRKKTSILHTGNKHFSKVNNFKIRNCKTNEIYLDFVELQKSENVPSKTILINLIGKGEYEFLDAKRQQQALNLYSTKMTDEERSNHFAQLAKERFTGVPKSEEQRIKMGLSSSEWIKNNPEEHKIRMDKINKNPEKIRKTAEKHRGMKRSKTTCENISKSLTGKPCSYKGKKLTHNNETLELKYFFIDEIPDNYTLGKPKK